MTFIVDGTLGGTFPSWTTATRPASPAVGQMGYNTTIGQFDAYTSGGWVSVATTTSTSNAITSAQMPTGSVLQVIIGYASTGVSTTTDTYIDTGLTATITPKFSTSKILVTVQQNGVSKSNTSTQNSLGLRLYRNGVNQVNFGLFVGYTATANDGIYGTAGVSLLDSPATTSATIYKTVFNSALNSGSVSVQNGSITSTIVLMEIAG
jgi:hypothetical protein